MLLTILLAQVFAEESSGQQEKTISEEESTGRKSPVVAKFTEDLLLNGLISMPPWAITNQLSIFGYRTQLVTLKANISKYWFLGSAKKY